MSFDAFLALPDNDGRMRHVVVTEGNRIVGVLRVNTALRQASEARAPVSPCVTSPAATSPSCARTTSCST